MTKYVQDKAIVFDAQSMRFEEWNGHLRVHNTNVTKANICEYYGVEINNHKQYGLDPERKYRFLRDPDALEKAVLSFAERPILYVHKAADADRLDNSKVIGTTGSNPVFEFPYIKVSITIWDGDYIDAIKSNTQAELSASYAFTPVMGKGEFEGEEYDGVMTEIYVDHVALVVEGRAGPDVRVADAKPKSIKPIHLKGKEMTKLNTVGKRLLIDLANLTNNGRANDSNAKDITSIITKANKTKRSMLPQVVSNLMQGYSMANDEEAKKIEETVNKAMDEADPENKVGDEDPVDTLDDADEDGDNPAKTGDAEGDDDPAKTGDEELDKDRASDHKPNPKHSQSPVKTASTQMQSRSSQPSIRAQAFDIASIERTIEQRLVTKAKQAQEARQAVKSLVGEWAMAEDSGDVILRTALTQIAGKAPPASMDYAGLRFAVDLANTQKTNSRANDSQRTAPSDLQRVGATRLRSI